VADSLNAQTSEVGLVKLLAVLQPSKDKDEDSKSLLQNSTFGFELLFRLPNTGLGLLWDPLVPEYRASLSRRQLAAKF
jgi:hypothetical protein